MVQKPILLIQVGPIHLFWITGVYYLWALKNKYCFVILANNDYLKSKKFKKIIKYFNIKYIHYGKNKKGFSLVSNYLFTYNKILKKFKPQKILLHNNSFIDNQCLIHMAINQDYEIDIFNYQNGRESLNIKNDRLTETLLQSVILNDRYKFLRYLPKIRLNLTKLKQSLKYYYYYKIIPFFLIGKLFTPTFNIFTGEANKIKSDNPSKLIKKYFLYLEAELKTYKKIQAENISGSKFSNYQIIEHPLITCGKQVNDILYGKTTVKKNILFAPSYGFIDLMGNKYPITKDTINFYAGKYIDVFKILLKKFPNHSIMIRIHPNNVHGNLWKNIIKVISKEIKNIYVIKKNINIEKFLLESDIIVSDVSSVLWWTIFLKRKIAISLDIFNYKNGDEMRSYSPLIHHINNLNKLKKVNFSKKNIINDKKSVTKFV